MTLNGKSKHDNRPTSGVVHAVPPNVLPTATNKSVSNDIKVQAPLLWCIRSTVFISVQYGGLSTKSQSPIFSTSANLGKVSAGDFQAAEPRSRAASTKIACRWVSGKLEKSGDPKILPLVLSLSKLALGEQKEITSFDPYYQAVRV